MNPLELPVSSSVIGIHLAWPGLRPRPYPFAVASATALA
jgi:hypothetical protein